MVYLSKNFRIYMWWLNQHMWKERKKWVREHDRIAMLSKVQNIGERCIRLDLWVSEHFPEKGDLCWDWKAGQDLEKWIEER